MGVLWTPAYAGVTGFIGFAFGSVENGITISHNERISSLSWITAGADGCGMIAMRKYTLFKSVGDGLCPRRY